MIIILLSAYNGVKYLQAQLDSIISQSYDEIKLIIRNDGSTDNGATSKLIGEYIVKHNEIDIEYIQGKNLGFVGSFSSLLKYALEKYPNADRFAFSDQDDIWLKDKLSVAIKYLYELECEKGVSIPLAYACNKTLVDSNLSVIRKISINSKPVITLKTVLLKNYATGCTMVFNRVAAMLYMSTINDKVKVHDYWMYLICCYFGSFYYDMTPHILYRQHSDNQIGAPSCIKRWKNRLSYGFNKSNGLISTQTEIFKRSFLNTLNPVQNDILSKIINYKRSIKNRLRLLFDREYFYPTIEENVIFKLKIIFGFL